MDREVAEGRNSAPVNGCMPSTHVWVEAGRRFTDLGQSLENRSSQDIVGEELRA